MDRWNRACCQGSHSPIYLSAWRYVPCAAVSRSIAKTSKSWRIAVTLVSVRHGVLSNLQKKVLVSAQTLKIENLCVDMNMITQLRFDYAVALRLRTQGLNATGLAYLASSPGSFLERREPGVDFRRVIVHVINQGHSHSSNRCHVS